MAVFTTAINEILALPGKIDPVQYAKTRNYLDGSVSRLSPYISRGVISLPFIFATIRERYSLEDSMKFLQELAWREYFQRVWESKGDEIFTDLKFPQPDVLHHETPTAVMQAEYGHPYHRCSKSVNFMTAGYLHNHLRMYIASMVCNIGKAHWQNPSSWMYYHLLDGDIASNTLSWQWVAGSFASKKYYCNQDNINAYTKTYQKGTFLDNPYEILPKMKLPDTLRSTELFEASTAIPEIDETVHENPEKIFIYNHYQLDPNWRSEEKGMRILLLEPDHFSRFPISKKVLGLYFIVGCQYKRDPGIYRELGRAL
ncbi:MAG: FAD-binding domain-containing protein [Ferruginibacter sp.]